MTYARKMVARCIHAARLANHEALRATNPEDKAILRDLARMNMQQAKQSKQTARASGQWGTA